MVLKSQAVCLTLSHMEVIMLLRHPFAHVTWSAHTISYHLVPRRCSRAAGCARPLRTDCPRRRGGLCTLCPTARGAHRQSRPAVSPPIMLPGLLSACSWRWGASLLFSVLYGYIAAKSRRAEQVLIPLLDILQSVPVLGFLSITVTRFIALFPGSLLGLELASLFAIFTSQVWNMTFSFYQSLRTVPREWTRPSRSIACRALAAILRLEMPAATIGLLWNAMMSFGGWFFVAASEAISVLNQSYTLRAWLVCHP